MGYLKGMLGKARNYMTQAKNSASQARQDKELA